MELDDFRKHGHMLVDWMADYLERIDSLPVCSLSKPKEVIRQLPEKAPEKGEPFEALFADFNDIVLPGITHWQHPGFFAYFPANSSPPSVLAEMLTATLGVQGMIWQTSPAAAELEERVMEWLQEMLGLPGSFEGVIQDTASTATLCSLLTAREKFSNYAINKSGFTKEVRYTIYCSSQAHSSIEKAVKIAGFGKESLHLIDVDDTFAMIPERLEEAVVRDKSQGFTPLAVVVAIGTTGSTAIDPLRPVGEICKKHNLWLHVDAALAGSALVLPEFRWMVDGIELADSFVFNPHKWMFTNFDCSAYFVQDKEALVRTFEIMPEYLKTKEDERVKNYRDWGIPLGRRFRALKLWFVIRSYGVDGIRKIIKNHINMARDIEERIETLPDFEMLAPRPLNTLCFRYVPEGVNDVDALNQVNASLLEELNRTGKLYLTHTKLGGAYTLRLVIGQTRVTQKHVDDAWDRIVATARQARLL